MRALRDRYREDARVTALAAALRDDRELTVGAVHGGLFAVLIAALCVRTDARERPRLIVSTDPGQLVDDLDELGVVAAHLPELDRFAGAEDDQRAADDASGLDRAGHNRRLAALEAFAGGAVLVASPFAAEQPVPDIQQVKAGSIVLRPGMDQDLHQLIERLVETGYRVVTSVEGRGDLATRGGILDVFPWIGQDPLRIEFFGDTIEAIRRFDAFTQESISKADEAVLASSAGGLATKGLWEQLPPGPVLVLGDVTLRSRLKKDHGRREVRLARQLEQDAVDGASTTIERLRGDLRRGLSDLVSMSAEMASADHATTVHLFARNEEAKRDLEAHALDAGLSNTTVAVGRLSAGFRDLERALIAVHDYELAEREPVKRRTARVAGGTPLSSLTDLKRNDHVVHLRHGIGIFRGMATLEKRGFLEDFLLLEFAEGSKLYVPVDAIDLVQKYVGASGRAPELSKIGGALWAKKRARAEKAIEDMSAELLAAQAARIAAGGIAMASDSPDVRRFEAAFPYEETEDQLSATREIKGDLERGVAMDRLLCGDVGFGKTEVAMRAAFKAVSSGYQVAVLVPTTLLAEQHVETFTERFAGFGVNIGGITRFRDGKERAQLFATAASGALHILIGTHAILTEKLTFARLGLLIIDEEHRFGVKQKEKLRAFRTAGVTRMPPDVLTLSATPIPRTLHFSMLGLRDISVLAEAPAERLAVESRVAPWDDQMIEHALARELERQGQIFVVHNQVKDLDQIAYKFARLAPTLKVDVVHGQMDETRLAQVMDDFRHRKLDCLVSTSIIESGIDIPNANTLFVNNAHCFGLAELHQIRGRIGRFTRQAYAYFLTPRNRDLGEDARERLSAIQEYAELGAGFKLAMRDLELRGAGNLLGGEQSGQIDAIGYELYTKLLGETVRRAKATAEHDAAGTTAPASTTKPAPRSIKATANADEAAAMLSAAMGGGTVDAVLGLRLDAYIPDTYLETPTLKFEIHQQLDRARRFSDLAAIARGVRDRCGLMPAPVVRLFQARAIRLRCRELGISRIDVGERTLRLHLKSGLPKELAAVKLPELVHLQLDGPVLVLFVKPVLEQDVALVLLCRLFQLDLGFLGRGF